MRPLSSLKSLVRYSRRRKELSRTLTTYHRSLPASMQPLPSSISTPSQHVAKKIKTFPPPPSPAANFREPLKNLDAEQIQTLDPSGVRTELFTRSNPSAAKVGDILLVRQKSGDPFAGVCINIRRQGVESAILLRNELMKVGVEMWFKIYSPNVEGIEVVQRRPRRARRERLTYMRKPDHDVGSVQNLVAAYTKSKILSRLENEKGITGQRSSRKKTKGKR